MLQHKFCSKYIVKNHKISHFCHDPTSVHTLYVRMYVLTEIEQCVSCMDSIICVETIVGELLLTEPCMRGPAALYRSFITITTSSAITKPHGYSEQSRMWSNHPFETSHALFGNRVSPKAQALA